LDVWSKVFVKKATGDPLAFTTRSGLPHTSILGPL